MKRRDEELRKLELELGWKVLEFCRRGFIGSFLLFDFVIGCGWSLYCKVGLMLNC